MWRRALRQVVPLALVSLVTLSLLPSAALALEPDNDDDAYDQISCFGIEEDDVEDVDSSAVQNQFGMIDLPGSSSRNLGNDPFEFSSFPNNNFDLPFEIVDTNSFIFAPTFTEDEEKRVNDSYYPEPAVSFEQVSTNAEPGQDVNVLINSSTFQTEATPGAGFYYAAFVDGIFINGYNAGAIWDEVEELQVAVTDASRPDCGTFFRPTQTDNDGDGMDDSWEVRHGLDPNDPSDAGLDPDNDGYVADLYQNALGEFVHPAPLVRDGELGDGVFTNYEEYVFGTNPNSADSDGDGYQDEADLVGLGQQAIKFKATKDFEDGPYDLHAIVVGSLQKRNEEEKKLIKIDSAFTQIHSRRPEDLEVELRVQDAVAKAGETLTVEALPSRTKAKDLALSYNWLVNGELQTDQSGQSQRTLEYLIPEGSVPGDQFLIEVQVINPETGQLARGRTTITLGDSIILEYEPTDIDQGSVAAVTALLTAGLPPEDYLFLWTLDGQLLKSASKLGANRLEFAVTKSGGEDYDLSLEVLDRQSNLFGQISQVLTVQTPTVTLELTPAEPGQDDIVSVRADVENFNSETLFYDFTVDGEPQESGGAQIAMEAGDEGSSHTVSVTVESTGFELQSASDQVQFVTGPPRSTALFGGVNASNNITARLIDNIGVIGTFAGLIVIGGTGAIVYNRKVRLKTS